MKQWYRWRVQDSWYIALERLRAQLTAGYAPSPPGRCRGGAAWVVVVGQFLTWSVTLFLTLSLVHVRTVENLWRRCLLFWVKVKNKEKLSEWIVSVVINFPLFLKIVFFFSFNKWLKAKKMLMSMSTLLFHLYGKLVVFTVNHLLHLRHIVQ